METLELSSTETVAIQVPKILAKRIEHAAQEHNLTPAGFLDRAVEALHIAEVNRRLALIDEKPVRDEEELMDLVQSWVDEIRAEHFHADRR